MLHDLKIGVRLSGLVVVLLAFLAVVSYQGYTGMAAMQASLKTVYEDRTVPAIQLAEMMDLLGDIRESGASLANAGDAAGRAGAKKTISGARQNIESVWAEYMKTYLTPEEAKLAKQAEAEKAKYFAIIDRIAQLSDQGNFTEASRVEGSEADSEFRSINEAFDNLKQLQADVAKSEYEKASQQFSDDTRFEIGLIAAAVVLGGGLALLIMKSITGPLSGIISVMKELERGNLSVAVGGVDRRDEIGDVARAVEVFKAGLAETEALKAQQARQAAEAEAQRKASMRKMADDFEHAVGSIIRGVASAATQLQASAQTLTGTANGTVGQSNLVAAASEEVSVNIQTVAAAAEELSASVNEINRQLSKAQEITESAVGTAKDTRDEMGYLSASAKQIVAIVSLINDIAEQTNLLALNATIEAARAGENGKGFAVVASEVKALATQTAKATKDIETQILDMQEKTERSVDSMAKISDVIGSINHVSTTIGSAVEEQSATTQEIARNVQQAALGASEVSSQMVLITNGAQTTSTEVDQVLGAAQELSRQSEHLNAEVEKFLRTVRADAA